MGKMTLIQKIKGRAKAKDDLLKLEHGHLWDSLGFHKNIAGFMYEYVLSLIMIPVSILLLPVILGNFFPFPEIRGYQELTSGLVALLFGVFDLGTGGTQGNMSDTFMRFISQYRASDPKRAIGYVQFFNFFQMTTGLIQITGISIYVFTVLIHQTLAHFAWFFLVYSLIQYPGMLQVFESAIKSFQRFDKATLVAYMRDAVWYPLFQIIVMSIGLLVGRNHPYGLMMIMGIFYTASLYIGDMVAVFYGGWQFMKIIRPLGFKTRDLFGTDFLKMGIVKETMSFVGVIWMATQLLGVFGLITNIWIVVWVAAAATWKGLISTGNSVANLATGFAGPMNTLMTGVSEAYNNGKKEFSKYYLQNGLKYTGFVAVSRIVPLVIIIPKALDSLIAVMPSLAQYEAMLPILPILIVVKAMMPLERFPRGIFVATHNRNWVIFGRYINPPIAFLFTYLLLRVFEVGWLGLVLPAFFANTIEWVVSIIIVQKRILKIDYKKAFWQGLAAPFLAGIFYAAICWIFTLLWDTIISFFDLFLPTEFAAIAWVGIWLVLFMLFWDILFYRPFYALFGGWDKQTLSDWEKARFMAGPSRFIVRWQYAIDKFFSQKSPWFNKFPLCDYDKVFKERDELSTAINSKKQPPEP